MTSPTEAQSPLPKRTDVLVAPSVGESEIDGQQTPDDVKKLYTKYGAEEVFHHLKRLKSIPPAPIEFHLESKSGIAVIVTSDYARTQYQDTLVGTKNDGIQIAKIFEAFNIQVVLLQNEDAAYNNVEAHFRALSTYLNGIESRMENKVLIFAFSGHGNHSGDDTIVVTDKGFNLLLCKEIIPHFVGNPAHFHIPKLFLIDACRGNKEVTIVSKLGSGKNLFLNTEIFSLPMPQ